MSKKPMEVLPKDFFPHDVKTPEERFKHLGRKLFVVKAKPAGGEEPEENAVARKYRAPEGTPESV